MLFTLYMIIGSYYSNNIAKKNYLKFNSAYINSSLIKVDIAYKGNRIQMKNNHEKYVFYPHTNDSLNKGKHFNLFAKKGDFIFKKRYSDTLYLNKKGVIYKYTFQKKF